VDPQEGDDVGKTQDSAVGYTVDAAVG